VSAGDCEVPLLMDVVVTVPKALWSDWIEEGDAAPAVGSADWEGEYEYGFNLYGPVPNINPGERVYIVAHGMVRGYAPLVAIERGSTRFGGRGHGFALVRHGLAVAVTIPDPVRGFQGWRYRWWERGDERPFPDWQRRGLGA
jgi:hypothetical protein